MKLKNAPHRQSCLYPESLFRSLYNLERDRAELTGKSFPLMVIDVSRLDTSEIIRWLVPLEKCLLDISRAYDWKGWHRRGRSIGIIYTEPPCMQEIMLRQSILDSARPLIGHCRVEEISISIEHVKGRIRGAERFGMGHDATDPAFDEIEAGNLVAV